MHAINRFLLTFVLPIATSISCLAWAQAPSISVLTSDFQHKAIGKNAKNTNTLLKQYLAENKLSGQAHYFALHNLAYSYRRLNQKQEAINTFDQAINLSQNLDTYYLATSLLERAKTYGILFRDTDRAIIDLEQALTIVTTSTHSKAANCHFDLLTAMAQAYNQKAQLDLASNYITQAIHLAEQQNNNSDKLYALIIAGRIAFQESKFQQAHQLYQQALVLTDENTPKSRLASIELRLAIIFDEQKRYQQSLTHAKKAVELYQEVGNKRLQIKAMRVLGTSYMSLGNDIDTALVHFLNALTLALELNDPINIGQLEYLTGNAYLLEGNLEKAKQYLTAADKILNQQDNPFYWGLNNLALAKLKEQQQSSQQAIELLEQTLSSESLATYPALVNELQTALIDLYQKKQKFQLAYQLQTKRYQQQSMLLEKAKQASVQQVTFEVERKQLQQQLANQKSQSSQASQQATTNLKQRNLASSLALILLIALFIGFYKLSRQKNAYLTLKANSQLSWSGFWQHIQQNSYKTSANMQNKGLAMLVLQPNINKQVMAKQQYQVIEQVEQQIANVSELLISRQAGLWLLTSTADFNRLMPSLLAKLADNHIEASLIYLPLDDMPEHYSKDLIELIQALFYHALEHSDRQHINIEMEKSALSFIFNDHPGLDAGLKQALSHGMIRFNSIS